MEVPQTTPSKWKLRGIYYLAQISGLIVLFSFGFVISSFPEQFAFLKDVKRIALLIYAIFAAHLVLFILFEVFQKKIFFVISRYAWVFFFLTAVYVNGGVESPFLFLLVFPLLTSATDLNERATKIVGILITVIFGSMILFDPILLSDPTSIIKHSMRTVLFGVISYYVYSLVKVTLSQRYEKEEAKRKTSELIELDRVKTDFFTVAEHQLRTPLSALRWAFENLRADTSIKPESRTILDEGEKKVADAIAIVNEMLKTAETKGPGFLLEKREVSLSEIIRSVLEELEFLTTQKRTVISFAPTKDVAVIGDPKFLKTAFLNILDNAVRYSPNGKVGITLASEEGKAKIAITDTGIGIASDDLPYLFERFYRGKNAIALDPNESGVGLYIARQIVERHGGNLSLVSGLGKGTRVSIALPLDG